MASEHDVDNHPEAPCLQKKYRNRTWADNRLVRAKQHELARQQIGRCGYDNENTPERQANIKIEQGSTCRD